jgi:hypothetical protein
MPRTPSAENTGTWVTILFSSVLSIFIIFMVRSHGCPSGVYGCPFPWRFQWRNWPTKILLFCCDVVWHPQGFRNLRSGTFSYSWQLPSRLLFFHAVWAALQTKIHKLPDVTKRHLSTVETSSYVILVFLRLYFSFLLWVFVNIVTQEMLPRR